MKTEDARSLSAKAQEALRRLVVQAVREGLTQAEAARLFGVARGTVNGWMGLWEREGSPGLKAGRRGRPPCPRLAPPQAATTVRLILSRCPDQLRLPFALWTREAVQQLLARRFGVHVSVWTVGRYLRAWGLTPQKPVRRAYEQNPAAVRRGCRRNTRPSGRKPSEKRPRFTGATRWGCAQIIKPAAPMDAAARRPWCLAPVSASAAT